MGSLVLDSALWHGFILPQLSNGPGQVTRLLSTEWRPEEADILWKYKGQSRGDVWMRLLRAAATGNLGCRQVLDKWCEDVERLASDMNSYQNRRMEAFVEDEWWPEHDDAWATAFRRHFRQVLDDAMYS